MNNYTKNEFVKRLFQAIRRQWLVKIKRRIQVQRQVKQKNNSKFDNNNDENAKPGEGTRKGKERTNRQIYIHRNKAKRISQLEAEPNKNKLIMFDLYKGLI